MNTDKQSVSLHPLRNSDWEDFIQANQDSFNYGALEEFGERHTYFEEEGQVISRRTILQSLEHGRAYWIIHQGQRVGGLVLLLEGSVGELETLFISPQVHSQGLGLAAWQAVEQTFPDVEVWRTITPYYDQRNIHFYVNHCGFQMRVGQKSVIRRRDFPSLSYFQAQAETVSQTVSLPPPHTSNSLGIDCWRL